MALIDELKKEEQLLIKQLDVVRAAILVYSGSVITSTDSNVYFPTAASKEKQIIWIFENKLSKGSKLRDVQEFYNQLRGKDDVKIDNTARRMKREGKLILVKYNDQNLLSYWGLPEWAGKNDFQDEFKPDMESLPYIENSVLYRKE